MTEENMTTIITVNHDAKRFIELCIMAVHLKTKTPYEHVIIDNGSNGETLGMLRRFAADKRITLHERRLPKTAAGHAASLDWFLRRTRLSTFCLLDSDAYPVMDDWLGHLIRQMGDAAACGCSHFRDESLLHPSCALFRYDAYAAVGMPSFAIRRIGGRFMDTAMIVCEELKKRNHKMIPIDRTSKMNEIVRHRWRATRAEIAPNGMLDGESVALHHAETERWFQQAAELFK